MKLACVVHRFGTDIAGGSEMLVTGNILAANDHLHQPLARLLKDALHPAVVK